MIEVLYKKLDVSTFQLGKHSVGMIHLQYQLARSC